MVARRVLMGTDRTPAEPWRRIDSTGPGDVPYRGRVDTPLTRSQLVNWRTAVFTIFFVTGLGFASWASRLPAVKRDLGINDLEIGILLFISGAAAIVGL